MKKRIQPTIDLIQKSKRSSNNPIFHSETLCEITKTKSNRTQNSKSMYLASSIDKHESYS